MKLLKDLGQLYPTATSKRKYKFGLYECPDCLLPFKALTNNMNRTPSAGCKPCSSIRHKGKSFHVTHGKTGTPLHNVWRNMTARCRNPSLPTYCDYGGRGITVDPIWAGDFTIFEDWALNNGYAPDLSIDRRDNDGNYCADNCRWVPQVVQKQNTRKIRKTNTSGYRGIAPNGNNWRAAISVNNTIHRLGTHKTKLAAAQAYDQYIKDNKLEHTPNGVL